MERRSTTEETIREYLLGTLSEPELSEIEQELFFNEELSRTADLIEDEIIEQYLDQELEPRERKAVETHFLLPAARREKLDFVRLLRHRIESHIPGPSVPVPRTFPAWLRHYSVPVTATICLLPVAYLAPALYQARIENKALAAKIQATSNLPIASIQFPLKYGVTRGHNSLPQVVIPPTVRTIKTDLILPGRFAESFDIRLLDRTHDETQEIWMKKSVQPALSQPRLIFDMPTQGIRTGTYDIVVSDSANNSLSVSYPFDATVSQTP